MTSSLIAIRMEIETEGAMLKFLVDECKGKWSMYCYIYDSTHFNNLDTARKWVVSKWIFFWLYNDTNVNVEMLPCWTQLKRRKVPCNQNDGFHILDMSWKFLHYHISWFFKIFGLWLAISSGLSMKLASKANDWICLSPF